MTTTPLQLSAQEIAGLVSMRMDITPELCAQETRFVRRGTAAGAPLPASLVGGWALWARSPSEARTICEFVGGELYLDMKDDALPFVVTVPPARTGGVSAAAPELALPARAGLDPTTPFAVPYGSGEFPEASNVAWECGTVTAEMLAEGGRLVNRRQGATQVVPGPEYLGGTFYYDANSWCYLAAKAVAVREGGEIFWDEYVGGYAVLVAPRAH